MYFIAFIARWNYRIPIREVLDIISCSLYSATPPQPCQLRTFERRDLADSHVKLAPKLRYQTSFKLKICRKDVLIAASTLCFLPPLPPSSFCLYAFALHATRTQKKKSMPSCEPHNVVSPSSIFPKPQEFSACYRIWFVRVVRLLVHGADAHLAKRK